VASQIEGYLEVLQRVDARIPYQQDDGDVLGFAASGVVHAFAIPEMRRQMVGNRFADDTEADKHDDESEISVSMPDYLNPYYDTAAAGRLRVSSASRSPWSWRTNGSTDTKAGASCNSAAGPLPSARHETSGQCTYPVEPASLRSWENL